MIIQIVTASLLFVSYSSAFAGVPGPVRPALQHFSLQSCSAKMCVSAKGEGAFVSQTHRSVSATKIEIKIGASAHTITTIHCAAFRYDFASEFLTCDNRDVGRPSLTIDRQFKIAKF